MRMRTVSLRAALGMAAAIGLFCCGAASAAVYSFNETFDAPPLTAGTPDPVNGYDWENGFVNGDNGWLLIEQPQSGSSLGQRPVAFWPHNDDTAVANVRARGGAATAYAIRDLSSTPLKSGNVTLVTAGYTVIGDISQTLRLANADGTEEALKLNFGAPQAGTDVNDYFRASQDGYASAIVADVNTQTTGGAPLKWNINGFSSSSGDYVILSIDFDAVVHNATVNITTVDALGTHRSIAPVDLSLNPGLASIGRISLSANTVGGNGNLAYWGNFSISGEVVPEPSMLSLAGIVGAAFMRRRPGR